MKILFTVVLTLMTAVLFGQESDAIFSFDDNEFQSWNYQDFIKNNIRKIEGYSFLIKKNGKVSKDSLLLFRKELDKDSNRVFGRSCSRVFQSHAPSYLAWYSFQTFYDRNGNVVKKIDSPDKVEITKSKFGIGWKTTYNASSYKYDSSGNLTCENNQHYQNSYSLFKHSIDTSQYYTVESKIREYIYNNKGQKISSFNTDDSTRYLPTKSYKPDSNSVKCLYCAPRYLSAEWTYYENGKVKTWIWYTRDGKVHSKRNYYYDNKSNLIKQVDSTGWYYTTILPYCESTTIYEYSDTSKTVIKTFNTKAGYEDEKTITKFNAQNQITNECSVVDSSETCTTYFYTYKDGKLLSANSIGDHKIGIQLRYTSQGLLYEKKVIHGSKISQLTRYYYE